MNKKILISIVLVLIIIISGCSQQVEVQTEANVVKPTELTEEQKEIIQLLGTDNNIQIYDFEIDSSYKNVEIWIDEYENGKYVSTRSKMSSQLNTDQGKIAIIRDNNIKDNWEISVKSGGSIATYSITPEPNEAYDEKYSLASGQLNNPVEFKGEEEIILSSVIFDEDDSITIYEPQYYVDNPEALSEYNYAFLIKCKFSKQVVQ